MNAHRAGATSPSVMRRHTRLGAEKRLRTQPLRWHAIVLIAVALLATVAAVGGGLSRAAIDASPAASPLASPQASPMTTEPTFAANIILGDVTIELTDTGFDPSHFESAVGRDVTVNLVNTGTREHNFTMEAFDIDIDLAPGETATVEIPQPDPGEYPYRSNLPGDEDFSGTMVIFI